MKRTVPVCVLHLIALAALCGLTAGCDDTDTAEPTPRPREPRVAQADDSIRKHIKPADPNKKPKTTDKTGSGDAGSGGKTGPVEPPPYPTPPVDTPSTPSAPSAPAESFSEDRPQNDNARALYYIGIEIGESLKVRPTLAVWLIDKTPGSASARSGMALGIPDACRRAVARSKGKNPLTTAVVGYGDDVKFLSEEPIEDTNQITNLMSGLGEDKTEKPATFAAVNQAADKFLPYRDKGLAVIFVIAADQSGDDWAQYDQALPKLKSKAVKVYGMGAAIPFGRPSTDIEGSKIPSESFALERIGLQYPPPNPDMGVENDLTDSGYGPYGLERICHDAKGRFFRIRAGEQSPGWQADANGEVDPAILKKYAPDYVSPQDYQKLLNENKCRMALHNAAMLPFTRVLRTDKANLTMYFTRPKDESRLAIMVSNAQKPVAEKSHDVDTLYDAMSKGESDRKSLTGARWQAEFDLAMGRILAAKSRIDGYNSLLASIKQGKAFKDPKSTAFKLHRAETSSSSSVLNKMATGSVAYLQRVMKEHPGTPWAALAERELTEQTGWEMGEE